MFWASTSLRVGTVSVCSHNGFQPSADPCPDCHVFYRTHEVTAQRTFEVSGLGIATVSVLVPTKSKAPEA
jgi:hypothetical protein